MVRSQAMRAMEAAFADLAMRKGVAPRDVEELLDGFEQLGWRAGANLWCVCPLLSL